MAPDRSHLSFSSLKDNQPILSRLPKEQDTLVYRLQSPKLIPKKLFRALRRHRDRPMLSQSQRLRLQRRYQIRLPSHSNSSEQSLLAQVLRRRQDLRISNSAFWRRLRSKNLGQSSRRTYRSLPKTRHTNFGVYGRYAHLSHTIRDLPTTHGLRCQITPTSRHLSQPREIKLDSFAKNPSPWPHLGYEEESHSPSSSEDIRHSQKRQNSTVNYKSDSKRDSAIHWQTLLHQRSLPSRVLQTEISGCRSSKQSPPLQSSLGQIISPSLLPIEKGSKVLLESKSDPEVQRKTPLNIFPNVDSDDGCFSVRLGSFSETYGVGHSLDDKRPILPNRIQQLIQLERDNSDHSFSPLLQRSDSSNAGAYPLPHGQHNSPLLSEKDGRHAPSSSISNRPNIEIPTPTQNSLYLKPHPRRIQHSRRRSQSLQKKRSRLQPRHVPLRRAKRSFRTAHNRPVRFKTQRSNSSFCNLVPRPKSHLSRCLQPLLAPRERIRLPTYPADSKSSIEADSDHSPLQPNSDSSLLAQISLVANSSTSIFQPNIHSPPSECHNPEQPPLISQNSTWNEVRRLSPQQQELANAAFSFISESTDPKLAKARHSTLSHFKSFLSNNRLPEDEFALISFIQSEILPKTSCYQTIQTTLSHIDVSRKLAGLPPFQSSSIVSEFKRAVKKKLPKIPSSAHLPDLSVILHAVLRSPPFPRPITLKLTHNDSTVSCHINKSITQRINRNRLRCLILTRLSTLMRSTDCASIKRSSIRRSHDPLHRPIVIFEYRGKAASIHNLSSESNYLEFLPRLPEICPASAMLLLKETVEETNPTHDSLFCSEKKPHQPLTSQRISSLTKKFLKELGIGEHRAHSLRRTANEFLRLNGVPGPDRDARGGWKPRNSSESVTQRLHYSSRFSSFNFAEILSRALKFNSSNVEQEIPAADEQPQAAKSSGQSPSNI